MKYKLASEEDRTRYAPELIGRGHVIVSDEAKYWVVKHTPGLIDIEKRELLGYLLGRQFTNVAEVRLVDQEEHQQVRALAGKGEDSLPSNTFLVRLGGSYSVDELPCKTIEQAVATELVYSIWIRRRDTHSDNRVYLQVQDIPIFFDHHIAFLGELEQANIATFFNPEPASYGHAGAWRVKERKENITTLEARTGNKAYHYVHDLDTFRKQVETAKIDLIRSLPDKWEEFISQVGFNDAKKEDIINFLKKNLDTLNEDVEIMGSIIYKD